MIESHPRRPARSPPPLPLAAARAAPIQSTAVAALRDAALKDDYAWDITEGLTTEVGPRLAGTEAEARARDWSVRQVERAGLRQRPRRDVRHAGVGARRRKRRDPRALPAAAGRHRARQQRRRPRPRASRPRWSASTASTRSSAAPDAAVRGKIVFVDHRHAARPRTARATASSARRAARARRIASRKGAIGDRHPLDRHRLSPQPAHRRDELRRGRRSRSRPARLSIPDAEQLAAHPQARQAGDDAAGPDSAATSARASRAMSSPKCRAATPALPPVLVAGHLDSWDLGTGAIDDAAGVRHRRRRGQADHGRRAAAAHDPHRLVRRRGSRPVRRARLSRQARQASRIMRSPKAISAPTASGRSTASSGAARKAEARGAASARSRRSASSPASFDRSRRLGHRPDARRRPSRGRLNQDGTRYFDLHHTPDDTLDKVDPAQLRQNVAAWTAMLAVLSGRIEPVRSRNGARRR